MTSPSTSTGRSASCPWYLASDLGRAVYHLLTRGVAPTLVGVVLFDISLPASAAAAVGFALSVPLAVVVSFGIRFLVASSAFWLLDQSGVKVMSGAFAIFFSGMMLPLVLFPGWLRHDRAGAAVGGLRAGAGRHLARQAHRERPSCWPWASR